MSETETKETDNLPQLPIGTAGKTPKAPKAKKQTTAEQLAEAGVLVTKRKTNKKKAKRKKAGKKAKAAKPKAPGSLGVNALLRPLRALESRKVAELEAVRAQIRRTRKLA